jgi:hypothetical protein
MRQVSYRVAVFESVSLAIYAVSLFLTSLSNETTLGSPVVETIIYLIFAALIYLVARGVRNAKSWARTPYFVTQVFVGITSYTLIAGTQLSFRLAGFLIGLVALGGLLAILKTPLETN